MHCQRFLRPGLSRRDMLLRCGNGFGALAAAALLARSGLRRDRGRRPLSATDRQPGTKQPAGRPGPRNSRPRRRA